MNLPIELKTRIYEHIGQVRNHLGEFAADERREILESIETHIHDALESRSTGEPGMELLDAIIAEMDPPESYGAAPLIAPPNSTSLSSGRKVLLFSSIATLSILFIVIWLADPFSSNWMGEAPPEEPVVPPRAFSPDDNLNKSTEAKTSPLIGKWVAIDFISSISEFNPPQTKWTGELELKGLQFFIDGSTDKPWWTWKGNRLFHSGDQSEAELSIVTINQSEYLFIEWLSGDVLINKESPKYYVLKRGAYIDPAEPKTIVEGVGRQALHNESSGVTQIDIIAPGNR